MKANKLFSTKQFGFLGGRSTTLQLLIVLDTWTEIMDNGGVIDSIYCDFLKAFDTVPHRRLIKEIKRYGISGKLLLWIENFLSGRQQRVRIQGQFSEWQFVSNGIPQGSVLGPLLFVLYINELPSLAKDSNIYLFADDMNIFKGIYNNDDMHKLQDDMDRTFECTQTSLLRFHPDKCKHMRIGKNNKTSHTVYTIGDDKQPLPLSEEEKDIGVIIDSDLSFESHISSKINKANSVLGLIARNMEYKDEYTLLTLYKSIVRPHLEYANQIWSPYLKKHIKSIENIQRRATKLIPNLKDLPYEERLSRLNLPTLAYRRMRGDAIETFKIIKGIYDTDVTDGLIRLNRTDLTRGHPYKIYKKRARLSIRQNSFFHRIVNTWNNLPTSVVEATSVISFEKRLDKYWKYHPLKYNYESSTTTTATTTTTVHDCVIEESTEELAPEATSA